MILPQLRLDVQISAHREEDEDYLVLHDPFDVADGPIMLHADMFEVLAACDGMTSTNDLARAAGVDPDGAEIHRVILFVRQLEELGFFEGGVAADRQQEALRHWNSLPSRPMTCAGQTYPEDAEQFEKFCREDLGIRRWDGQAPSHVVEESAVPHVALIPHIDFRVAPKVYGEAFSAIAASPANLVVMIGTSHYWSDHPVIVSNKPFETPLGQLPVIDHDMAVPEADIAHKPEHSLELHAVALKYLWPNRDVAILPVLVTSAIFEEGAIETWTQRIRDVVDRSGRTPIWLISGDLAHIGRKFGDPVPATEIVADAQKSDVGLIDCLVNGALDGYRREIENCNNAFRVCGYAPTVLALTCVEPSTGRLCSYDVWHEEETQSAVSFAAIVWQK
ncbi:MAG: AmmeMemoRadiSam system protein B [Candidatus Kapabacteria bacterium]|nr:AmmeMemoRadiSam system protein B [Candidatus Kapabacteria bacterium]